MYKNLAAMALACCWAVRECSPFSLRESAFFAWVP
jgi:hypothetical protein